LKKQEITHEPTDSTKNLYRPPAQTAPIEANQRAINKAKMMMAWCKNGAFVPYFASRFTSASMTRNMASNSENEKEFSLSRYKAELRGCPSFIIEAHQTATDHPKNPGTFTCHLSTMILFCNG
jgi:hypothetical protein